MFRDQRLKIRFEMLLRNSCNDDAQHFYLFLYLSIKQFYMKKTFTFLLLILLAASVVSAQRLLTEDFNYATGALTTVSGGNWTPFAGTAKPIQVINANLTYSGYVTNPSPTSGAVLLDTAKSNGENAYAKFSTVSSNTVYCTFLLDVLSVGNLFPNGTGKGEGFISFLPLSNSMANAAGVAIKRASTGFKLGVFPRINPDSVQIAWAKPKFSINTTLLVTMAYQFVPGEGNNLVMLWVNPRTDTLQISPDAQIIDIDSASKPRKFGKLALLQRSSHTPLCEIDAIKVSTDWNDAVLPLRLLSFNVIDNNGYASLSWQTCNEINMNKFEVQKSADAESFVGIGDVAAKNTSCGTTYTFKDPKALAGTAYYRIRMIDNDGSSSLSGIVHIDGKIPTKVSVFPNPVINYLVLAHPKAETGTMLIIVSLNGTVVASYVVQKDAIQTSVDVSTLAKGNYIVVFGNAQLKQTIKIVKQ